MLCIEGDVMDRIVRRNLTYAVFLVVNMTVLFASAYTVTFHGFYGGVMLFAVAIVLMVVFAVYHVKQMRLIGRKSGALSILFGDGYEGRASDGGNSTRWWVHVGRFALRVGFMVTTALSVMLFISERYLYGVMVLLPFPILILSFAFVRMMWLRRVRT